MANEAVLFFELQLPIPMTVTNATGIERGALLKLTDPMTAIITSASTDIIAGIAAEEKIASDGRTSVGVYRRGIFKVTASGSITTGDMLGAYENNQVYSLTALQTVTTSGSRVIGISFEDATDGQTFLMDLNINGGLQVA